jgi:hypothetical protein
MAGMAGAYGNDPVETLEVTFEVAGPVTATLTSIVP